MKKIIDTETKQLLDSLKNILETVEDAINKDANQAAFFCSLSIPDLAAQIDYPNLRGTGKVRKRYVKWYDENIYKYENPADTDIPKLNKIDGKIMYLTRCRLYHQGDYLHDDIIKQLSERYGENINLNFSYSSKESKVSILSDGDDRIKKVKVILNRKTMVKKLKQTAEGVLREYGYL